MTRRLALGCLALTAALLLVLLAPLGVALGRQQRDQLISRVRNDAHALSAFVESTLEGEADAAVDVAAVARLYRDRSGARVVIVDRQGVALIDTDPPPQGAASGRSFADRPEFREALSGRVASGLRRSTTLGAGLVYVATPVGSAGRVDGAVRLTYTTAQLDAHVRRQWAAMAAVAAGALAASAALSFAYARWVTGPLAAVHDAARRLGRGQLEARAADDDGPPEVRQLARSLNQSAARLERLVDGQRSFARHVSHQLRTPLTAVRLRLETLDARLGADETRDRRDLGLALEELGRLSGVIDQLLGLASAQGAGAEAATALDAGGLLEERAAMWAPLAAEHGLHLRLDHAHAAAAVLATPERVTQVLDNLLANAVDASPPGGVITLRAEREAHVGLVALHVIDDGPGLGEATERDPARALGGSGLGLPLARSLAQADNGRVELRRAPTGGVDAVVLLPEAAVAAR
ncbi:MAG: ATP-binding protein [Acidimicrobiales bacterium]